MKDFGFALMILGGSFLGVGLGGLCLFGIVTAFKISAPLGFLSMVGVGIFVGIIGTMFESEG